MNTFTYIILHSLLVIAVSLCVGYLIEKLTGAARRRRMVYLIGEQDKKQQQEVAEQLQWLDTVTQELTKQQDLKTSSAASTTADSRTPTGSSTRSGPSRT